MRALGEAADEEVASYLECGWSNVEAEEAAAVELRLNLECGKGCSGVKAYNGR